ncbi:MAG: CNNM domain-containing protein, partial [Lachnospiraceae bacterium]|nr:CNNM domain-containing protein [Lachnospiraceae bacterium]
MDTTGVIQSIILVILLILSAFFSSAETAFSTVNKIRMKALEEEGNKRARSVIRILDRYSKMISAILIGNNIVNIAASALATTMAMQIHLSVGIATGILTIVILLAGEILPKTWARINAERLSLSYCGVIYAFMQALTPLIFVVDKLAALFLKLLRIDPHKKMNTMTETELKTYVDVSHEDGVIETEEREMIYNVFDFSDALAKDLMIPRINMVTVNVDADYETVMDIFRDSMYTRLPVYQDGKDNIVGILNIKDFILTASKED